MSSAVTASTSSKLANSRVRIDESNASIPLGRGLVATQDVPAGNLLLRLHPLISVLDDVLLDNACSTCFAPSKMVDDISGRELFKCTGCNLIRYCSKVGPFLIATCLLTTRRASGRIGRYIIQENANIYSSIRKLFRS